MTISRRSTRKLIYCSITGFGQTGPRENDAAYDFMIQAMGGLMSITGEAEGRPGGGPQKVGVPIVDLMTGMYATIASLAALAHREVSGTGEYIDLAMLDVQAAMLANQAMNYLLTGKTPQRYGNGHPNISRSRCSRAATAKSCWRSAMTANTRSCATCSTGRNCGTSGSCATPAASVIATN